MLEHIYDPKFVPAWIKLLLILFEIFITFWSFRYIKNNQNSVDYKKMTAIFVMLLFTGFAVYYCVTYDYFAYKYRIELADAWGAGAMELFPQTVANMVNGNYELFRAIIFGSAICCVFVCSRLVKTDAVLVLLLWFTFFFDRSFYARATLGAAVYFLGVYLMSVKGKSKFLIGVLIALSSIFFHRQMIVAIAILPLFFFKLKKSTIVPFAFLFLLVAGAAAFTLFNSPEMFADSMDEEILEKVDDYVEATEVGYFMRFTTIGFIQLIFQYLFYYSPFFVISSSIFKREVTGIIPGYVYKVYNILLGIVLMATTFFLIFGQNNTFFYRTLYLGFIPSSILLVDLYYRGVIEQRKLMIVVYMSLIFHGSSWLVSLMSIFL